MVPQISELLKEGQEVLIQIAKEPIGEERRAHHQSHRAAGTLSGLHADGEPHRRVAQDLVGRRAAAAEADHPERARKRRRRFHCAHCGGGRYGRGTARRYPLSEEPVERDQVALRQQQVSGADLSRPECGGARAARSGELGFFRRSGSTPSRNTSAFCALRIASSRLWSSASSSTRKRRRSTISSG